jgi:Tfp pilus assembly protein PilF
MDRRLLFIGAGILIVVIVGIILIFTIPERSEPEEPIDQTRINTLTLAEEYLKDGEFQRALDLLDRLLIADSRDEEAKALRNAVIDAKRSYEDSEKERSQQEQEELKDAITDSIKEAAPAPAPVPEPAPEPVEKPEPVVQKEDPEVVAAREAAERRRLEEEQKANDVLNLIKSGIEAMEEERYIEARRNFTDALDLDEDSAEAYAQMGEAFFREDSESERNLQKAVEYSSKSIEKNQTYWLPHFTLGKIYESTKSWDNAAVEFAEAAKLNPERDDIWFELGKVQYRARQYAEAAQSFLTTTYLSPTSDKAYLNLGVTYERLGSLEDALTAYGAAFQANPEMRKRTTLPAPFSTNRKTMRMRFLFLKNPWPYLRPTWSRRVSWRQRIISSAILMQPS